MYNGLGLYDYLPLLLYAVYASWAAVLNLGGAMIVDWAGRINMLSIGLVRVSWLLNERLTKLTKAVFLGWMCAICRVRDRNGCRILWNVEQSRQWIWRLLPLCFRDVLCNLHRPY